MKKLQLRGRRVDRGQVRIVDAVQDLFERIGDAWIIEERFRRNTVWRARRTEAVAISQVAIEVVLKERAAKQPTDPEDRGPQQDTAD